MKTPVHIYIVFWIICLCSGISPAYTQAEETYHNRPDEGPPEYYRDHKGLPPEEMLSAAEYTLYARAIETEDCDTAYALLANAYAKVFPEQPHPSTNIYTSVDWEFNVGKEHYPGLLLCSVLRALEEYWVEIGRRGIAYERFTGQPRKNVEGWHRLAASIDTAIWRLFSLAKLEYPDAFLALARLSDEGKILRYAKEFQYFMVLHTRDLGIDCPELDALIERAEAALTPETRIVVRAQTKNGRFTVYTFFFE